MPAQPREEIEKRIPEAVSWVREGYQKYGITSDDFLKFLVKELKPFIDKNYKTQERQSSTYLAGSSMGGLISAYAICEYPNTFGSVACFSTHWTALNGVFIEYLKNNIPNPSNHKFYFDYGTLGLDSQYETYQIKVDSLMIAKGYEKNNKSKKSALETKISKKFNQKGWFKCLIKNNTYSEIVFGNPINFESWMNYVEKVIFSSIVVCTKEITGIIHNGDLLTHLGRISPRKIH